MTQLPMLAIASTKRGSTPAQNFETLMKSGLWLGDVKLDGIRAFARWDGHGWTFTNRTGTDITVRYPELQQIDLGLGDQPMWLDGEIVAVDGHFETALTRDKQESEATIMRMAMSHPVRFMAFDIPMYADWSYVDRRSALEDLVGDHSDAVLGLTVTSDDVHFLEYTNQLGLEGVIVKRKNSRYEFGARSRSWVKFKNLHRITCLVAGYTTGTGHRSHFGAMHLALLDDGGQVVPVGRVGTGFTEREINNLKARIDAAEVVVVEIECLNRTSGNTLRFPVYKGIRTDVQMLDCTTKQLDTLPVC